MERGPHQWCQKGSTEPVPKEQMVSAHFLRIRMTTSQQHISLDMKTQKLHYNCLTEMCTEADWVSGSWWTQYNMFIAQTVLFLFLSTANGFHSLWLRVIVFFFYYSFPSELFSSCGITSSFTRSSVLPILASPSFHFDKSTCQISTIFLLPFIFRVTLFLIPVFFWHLWFVSQNCVFSFHEGSQHLQEKK